LFEIPKIVTSKLADRDTNPRADAASHPDADLLTAFAERALPERERSTVMKHLAACSQCRAVVALAQPEEPAAGVVLIRSRPRSSSVLLLRWGALAACAVLAVSLVLFHRKQTGDTLVAEKRASELTSVPAVSAKPRPGHDSATPSANAPPNDADANTAAGLRLERQLSPPSLPAPPSIDNNEGFIANNSVSNNNSIFNNNNVSNTVTRTSDQNLPLNGRNFTQLNQIQPGAGVGAAAGGAMGAAPTAPDDKKQNEVSPDQAKVAQNQDKVAQKDDYSRVDAARAKEKTLAKAPAAQPIQVITGAATAETTGGAVAYGSLQGGTKGEIKGQVVDPSNAAVAGAKVTITNTATGQRIVSTTNSAGIYDVPSVPVGPYTITFSQTGFRDFVRQGVHLEPQTVAVNATLQVGAVSEMVSVEAAATAVQTETDQEANLNNKGELHASSAPLANRERFGAARQAATWQISNGGLQRSFDGGKSWEAVALSQPYKLRVVATSGFHVWAGGGGGILFHSADGGSHFVIVKVGNQNAALNGDIVTLNFQDAQHGRIESANHEVWTTVDGGQTWQQP
jgi:hypothetical protein